MAATLRDVASRIEWRKVAMRTIDQDAAAHPTGLGGLDAGALAVCAGTGVVPPAHVAAGDWGEITRRAGSFVAALSH